MSAACYRPTWSLISTRASRCPQVRAGRPRSWLSPSPASSRHRRAAWGRLRARFCLTIRALVERDERWGRQHHQLAGRLDRGGRLVNHEVSPSLFASALTTTVPPAAGAPPAAQSTVTPFGSSSAPGLARSFGQSLLVSQGQVPGSAHAGQEVDLLYGEATGSQIDETEEPEPFVKNIEKPNATAPAHAPEERLEPAPEPDPLPILPDNVLERAVDVDFSLLTTVFEAGSSRSERAQEARLVTGFLGRARVGHSVGSLCCSPHTIVAIESA